MYLDENPQGKPQERGREPHYPALDEVSEALLAAADLIERGHLMTDGMLRDHSGGFCTWGAIIEVAHNTKVELAAMFRVHRALGGDGSERGFNCQSVCDWNNSSDKKTVVAKLRAVALGGS